MRQKFSIRSFATLLLTAAALAACSEDRPAEQPAPAFEQGFSMGTRADGAGDPEHGDAYTLVSYRVGGTSSTNVDKFQIRMVAAFGKQFGYYAYDDGLLSGRPAGTLVPVDMRTFVEHNGTAANPPYVPQFGISPLVRDGKHAQMLNSVPETGPNPATNQGVYRTAVIHPAIPMLTSDLGYLAVFNHDDEVFASMPDDADGDPATDDPFEITVTHNDQVHALPAKTELYPVRSAVKVWFYSEYYYDDDTELEHPQEQLFTVASLNLYNIGSNGWYNARTGIVYPNYNYSGTYRNTYSSMEVVGTTTSRPNFKDLYPDVVTDGTTEGPGPAKHKFKYSVETPVFPSDYRGYENGGLFEVQPLVLQVVLNMSSGGQNKVSVPLALDMKRGMRYHFYVNVLSEVIVIKYSVAPWDAGYNDEEPIGGPMMDYATIRLEYSADGWVDGGGSNDEIGN